MMTFTERTLEYRQTALGNHPAQAAVRAEEAVSAQALAATGSDPAENAQSLSDELNALRRDHAKLQQAIFEAAQIQRKLCAPREHLWHDLEVAGEIFPVRHLSGDFFKVMELGAALVVILGDIAGKGLTAGIWQPHLMGLIQRAARRHSDPADAVAEVNSELCHDDAPPLTALFFARIDSRTNELVYCNAGLPAPLLLRANKTLEHLAQGGPMLGAMKNASFQSGTASLNPGDMLMAYSDGVTECRNPHEEEFEMDRLIAATRAVSGVNATRVLFSLIGTVLDFADSRSPNDDVTLLVVRRRDAFHSEQFASRTREFHDPQRRAASLSQPKRSGRGGRRPE